MLFHQCPLTRICINQHRSQANIMTSSLSRILRFLIKVFQLDCNHLRPGGECCQRTIFLLAAGSKHNSNSDMTASRFGNFVEGFTCLMHLQFLLVHYACKNEDRAAQLMISVDDKPAEPPSSHFDIEVGQGRRGMRADN